MRSNFSVVNEIFQEASDAINLDLWKIVNEDQELLNLTENTQPVMLAAGYATYKVLASEVSLTPISIAGHSLGEYTALVASGSLSFFDAAQLVRKRAELMQAAVPSGSGSMAAILGLDDTRVIEICLKASDKGVVEAVNFQFTRASSYCWRKKSGSTCLRANERGRCKTCTGTSSECSHLTARL